MQTIFRVVPRAPRLRASAVAAACLVALSLPVSASMAPMPDDGLPTFDRVVVTASPALPLTWETDPRLPRQPVPASDGADYLGTVPGFAVIRNGGSNGDPVLRGMFGSRLNVVGNGGSMPGACPARMDNPLSYVSPETFDRLVVVKGPQTVLWGPGASAGTVRFERVTERFDGPGLRMRGSLLGGSHGRGDQVFGLEAGAPAGYLRVDGNRSESGDYRDGGGAEVPSAWRKWNIDVAAGWTPDADTVLELSAGSGDGRARYAGRGMDGTKFGRDSLALRFAKRGLPGPLDGIEAVAWRNHADHVMDNYGLRDPMGMPMAANVDRRTRGGRVAVDRAWPRVSLVAGFDLQDSAHRRRGGMGRDAWRAQPRVRDAEFRNAGVFAEAAVRGDGGRWVAGLRVDRAGATDHREHLDGGHGGMDMPNPTSGQRRRHTLPSGFVRYEGRGAGAPLVWYAGLGHARRMPDYWELFPPQMGPAGAANAFAGIRPERTTQLDAGLQYRRGALDAWVSAYAGRIGDFILFDYGMGMSSVRNVDARVHGAEAGVGYRTASRWTFGGTLAWAWGENADAGTPLPQMPPLEARLTAGYEGQRLGLGLLWRLVAAQDRVAPGQGNVVGRDLGPAGGFGTLAVNASWRPGGRIRLSAGIDNLFDRDYGEHLNLAGNAAFGYPADPVRIHEPGRTAWVKVDLQY